MSSDHQSKPGMFCESRPARLALAVMILAYSALLSFPLRAQQYTYDLSGLPSYQPEKNQVGMLRIHGSQLSLHLIHTWEDAFLKLHPDIRYRDNILPSWFSGLCLGTEDLSVMGHEAWSPDIMAFHETFGYDPFEVLFATGGFDQDKRGDTPGVVIMVNQENPLRSLTLDQLDGILGAQRSGGWKGSQWDTSVARDSSADIRTWGQLGLSGKWKDQPIIIYGTDATQSLWAGTIQKVVFHGGDKWNPALRELVRGDHIHGAADLQTIAGVADNLYAIGFSFMKLIEANHSVKAMPIARTMNDAAVPPTLDTFRERSYPLVTGLYLYLNRVPGQAINPRLKEFLKFILSRQGQQLVVEDGMYIPLSPAAAQEQLRRLD